MASLSSKRQSPQKVLMSGLATAPTDPTDLSTKSTVLYQIVAANKTGSTINLFVRDKQVKWLLPGSAITASSAAIFEWQEGVMMVDGVTYNASATGLDVEVFGYVSTGS